MEKMPQYTIGFDAKRAQANRTGLGNYSRSVIEALVRDCPEWHYRMYIPKKRGTNTAYEALLSDRVTEHLPEGWLARHMSGLWRIFGMAEQLHRDGVQLFHGLSNELPTGLRAAGVRSVVTIHDLIFLRYPEYYNPIDRWIYTLKFRHACRCADRIIAASECTKRDIVELFGIDPAKIEVIYQGCSPEFRADIDEDELERVRLKYGLPNQYLFTVGTLEKRKNLMTALRTLEYLPSEVHLVAVGRRTKYTAQVERYAKKRGLTKRLHIFPDVPFADLPSLYCLAEVFIYPSRYEGFGIPIIEAISAGVPVIAATGSCLEETGGKASIYCAPDDARGFARAVEYIGSDDERRREIVARSEEYIRRFDLKRIAAQVTDLYKRVLEEK